MSELGTPPNVELQFTVGFCILDNRRLVTLTLYGEHEVTTALNVQGCKEIAGMLLCAGELLNADIAAKRIETLAKLNEAAENNGDEL